MWKNEADAVWNHFKYAIFISLFEAAALIRIPPLFSSFNLLHQDMPDLSAHLWHLPVIWLAAAEPAAMAGHLSEIWWRCTALTPRAAGPAAGSPVQSCALSFSFVLEGNGRGSNKTISQKGPFILKWSLWLIFWGLLGFFCCFVCGFSCIMLRCLPAMLEGTWKSLATCPGLDVLQILLPACSTVVKFGLDAHWCLGSLVTTVTTCHGWPDECQCSTWPAVPVPGIKESLTSSAQHLS